MYTFVDLESWELGYGVEEGRLGTHSFVPDNSQPTFKRKNKAVNESWTKEQNWMFSYPRNLWRVVECSVVETGRNTREEWNTAVITTTSENTVEI